MSQVNLLAVPAGLGPAVWVVLGIAAALLLTLILTGIVWSIAASRRATNNRKSAMALALALVGWLAGAVQVALARSGYSVAAFVLAVPLLTLVVCAIWLAARGLREIVHEPHRYKRGVMQSVAGIVLAAVLTNLLVISAMTVVHDRAIDRGAVAMNQPQRAVPALIPQQTQPSAPPPQKFSDFKSL